MAGVFADLVSAGDALKVGYPSKVVVAQLNEMRPFTKKLNGGLPAGAITESKGILKFNMNFERPQNGGQLADDDSLPILKDRIEKQGTLTPTLFSFGFTIGEMTRSKAASSPQAGFNGGELKRRTDETIADMGKFIEQQYVGTHGTGRRARVQDATTNANTFTAALPEGVTLLRVNHLISIRTTDGGASVSGTVDALKITAINTSTRLVTFDGDGTHDLTAGHHVHIVTKASQTLTSVSANGLRGLVDDATFASSIHGLARATYPKLNAYVNSNGGTLRDFTEKLLNRSCNAIAAQSGVWPTDAWLSPGQGEKWADFVRPDRRYMVTSKTSPQSKVTGYSDEELVHITPGGPLRITTSFDVIPREVYLLYMPAFIHYQAKDPGWWDDPILKPSVGSGVYKSSYQAYMSAIENIGCDFFGAQGVIRDLRDPAIGDTDPV